jgi:peptide deformylase
VIFYASYGTIAHIYQLLLRLDVGDLMPILEILHYPDPRLRNMAKPVEVFDQKLGEFADSMLETMYESSGIGLAATQVGVAKRVVVIDVSETRDQPLCLVNPEIIEREGEEESEEGCLSVPTIYEKVTRSEKIKLKAQDKNGDIFEIEADGVLAICIQHEIDHLDGKLFIDYLSGLKRQRIRKKMEKEARLAQA